MGCQHFVLFHFPLQSWEGSTALVWGHIKQVPCHLLSEMNRWHKLCHSQLAKVP